MAATAEQTTFYKAIDEIPVLAEARQQVRDRAWGLVATRQQMIENGAAESVPLPIDALSTAEKVIDAKNHFGKDSYEYKQKLSGLRLDTLRLVAEWHRKMTYEYFEPVRHIYEPETEDFYSHGLSVRQMTENALIPISDDQEAVERRVQERVEDATPQLVRKLGNFALERVGIRTISECSEKSISDYAQDVANNAKHRGYGGYVPEKEKIMIRDIRFDTNSDDRFEEQIAVPGKYIQHEIIQKALSRRGVDTVHMNKTDLLGVQMLVEDDLVEFVRLLDQVASEQWCVNIFMGELVSDDYDKNYENIRSDAKIRQESLKNMADTVAEFVLDLAQDNVDKRSAPAMVEDFVKTMLLKLAKNDTKLAEQMFDKKTATGLGEVQKLEALGRYDEAFLKFQEVEKSAPGGGYCSGGSCGLESVDTQSDSGKELMKKLKADNSDTVVKDNERSCRCGKKGIVYAYNKNKVNKLCTGCGAFETKRTK